ncbi:MAG: lytic transglycosylase domain-containing protein [Longimicrobiales bacterium]
MEHRHAGERENRERTGNPMGGSDRRTGENHTTKASPRSGATNSDQERRVQSSATARDEDRARRVRGNVISPEVRTGGWREGRNGDDGEDRVRRAARSVSAKVRKNRGTVAAAGLAASSIAMIAGGMNPGTEAPAQAALGGLADASETVRREVIPASAAFDLPQHEHENIDFFVDFLATQKHERTAEWLERIGKYGPMIQEELRARGMPQDLLYLTMIESGFDPNAYSAADAAGLWQFIEETGERYGLEVSEYVDERRDPVKATGAALTYLQDMHERFDSWFLSAAGYNTGENRVGRLMREVTGSEQGTEEDYWKIWSRLPRETRDYVPLMLAAREIAAEPAKYGFTNIELQDPLAFDEVIVAGGTSMADVAAAAGVSEAVIEDLNPHFVRKMTPPGREMAVRVPVGLQQQVAAAFEQPTPVTNRDLAD